MNMTETPNFKLPDFSEVTQAFGKLNALVSPAEAHGILAAFVCVGDRMNGKNWLDILLGIVDVDDDYRNQVSSLLIVLYGIVSNQLAEGDFSFQLLLPEDQQILHRRIVELGLWCQGFMSGLGLAGMQNSEAEDDEVKELLHDLNEISKVDAEYGMAVEEEEVAYTELVEYVRMGVIMLYSIFVEDSTVIEQEECERLH